MVSRKRLRVASKNHNTTCIITSHVVSQSQLSNRSEICWKLLVWPMWNHYATCEGSELDPSAQVAGATQKPQAAGRYRLR